MTGGQLGGQQIASVTVAVTILTTILVVAAFLVPIIYSGKWVQLDSSAVSLFVDKFVEFDKYCKSK